MHSIGKDKRGTSLVEILVVMVVLLVGIMTIIQMFPTGFRVVRAGESQSIATRLAQQEIELWKAMPANLPEAIVPIDENGTVWNDPDFAFPGPPFKGWIENPDASGTYIRGNALNCRQILSETTTVPAPSYFGTGSGTQFGSRYTLAFSPIAVDYDSDGKVVGLSIKSGDMRRNTYQQGAIPNLKPGNYGIVYGLAAGTGDNANTSVFFMTFPNDNAQRRVYYVSYSYWEEDSDGNQELRTVVDQPVYPSSGGWRFEWVPVPVPAPPTGSSIIGLEQNSDSCARGFVEQTGTFTQDPYEFKLADPIIGVIAFNPSGHDVYEYTALGLKPLQARISYRRYDPRIIREDKVVPAAPTKGDNDKIPMKMALRFILAIGDPTSNPNEETYKGLITGSVDVPLPLYIIDLASGLQVEMSGAELKDYAEDGLIDYKSGVIHLPKLRNLLDWQGNVVESDVPMSGRQLRFYYRADGDWTVQVQKACTNYTRTYNADGITYNGFALVNPDSSVRPEANRLLFHPSQGEQTVSVDFTYGPTGGGTLGEHRVVGYSAQIQTDSQTGKWCVDLPLPDGQEIKRVSVVGISFRARVIWRDEGAWRHVDMDTTLVRQ